MRKLFKKSLACVLAVALCLTAMVGVLTVSAADALDGTIEIADVTIEAGSTTATIPVTFAVTGDEADLINVAYLNYEVDGATVDSIYDNVGPVNFNADMFEIYFNDNGEGGEKSVTVNFDVKDFAESFTVKVYDNTSATNTEKLINFGEAEKTFTVEEPECEHVDANQDGICDNECGYENLDETLAFYGKGIVLGDDIRGVYQVRKQKKTNPSPYVSFKVIAEKEGVKSELELVATSDKTNYTTYGYAITVAPKEMVDIIEARIVGITAEGEAFISNVDTWSIKQGFIELMDTYSAQTTEAAVDRMKLCANTLNYGAEAQKFFDYKEDNLATDDLPEAYAAYIITETPVMETIPATDDSTATAKLSTIGFNLAAKVQILPCFKIAKADAKEDYSAEITQVHTAPDGTVTTSEYTIAGADCLKSGSTLGVYIQNLRSNDLRDVLTVTLYKNGEVVSATHTFSCESVAKGKYDENQENPVLLYSVLMVYGDCARACFG